MSRIALRDKLKTHHDYIRVHGDDLPEVRGWTWGAYTGAPAASRKGVKAGPVKGGSRKKKRRVADTSADSA